MRSERDAPYVFVGREAELQRLTGLAGRILEQGENLAGVSLVDGIPGIGKTHFLDALHRRLRREFSPRGVRVARARTNGALLPDNNESLFSMLALPAAPRQSVLEKVGKYVGDFSFTLPGTGFNMKLLEGRDFRIRDIDAELRRTVTEGWWRDTLLLVTVDEVQNATGEAARTALNRLQAGFPDIPMMVVCAGLPNSRHVLREMGISRRAVNLTLPTLSPDEARNGFSQGLPLALSERGLNDTPVAEHLPLEAQQEIADQAQCFPRHLMIAIEATADSILGFVRDGGDFSVAAISEMISEERGKYYAERVSATGQYSGTFMALAEQMNRRSSAVDAGLAEQLVMDSARLESGQTPRDVLATAVGAGLFVYDEQSETYAPGIPSMISWLLDKAASRT